MSVYRSQDFYVADTDDGRVFVGLALPVGEVLEGPIQKLHVEGEGPVSVPKEPMTETGFREWREGLEAAGFHVELKFL